MSDEDPLSFIESRALEGERKPTYWCMPAILSSLFFLSSFLSAHSYVMIFFLKITITLLLLLLLCMVRVFYIVSTMTGFYYFSL